MAKVITMSISDFERYTDDSNPKVAIARCCFLSTRPNSHNLIIDEKTLREYAPTILGMFLIGNMNWSETDTLSHEKKPFIFGYFPENQEIEYVKKDGYLLAYADAVVSKLYANEYYEMFSKDNFRNTSVEMLVDVEELNGLKYVKSFNICGLTTLGKKINGSCPDAHIKITRFSENEARGFYASLWDDIKMKKGVDQMPTPTDEEKNVVMETEIEQQSDEQQEEMAEQVECADTEEKEEQIEEKQSDESEEVKAEETSEEEVKEEKCSEEVKEEKCAEEESKDDEDDASDEDDDKDDSDDGDKEAKMQEQIAELMSQIEEQKATIETLNATVAELSEYKSNIENAQKESVITATLAQVKGKMSDEDYAKFEQSGANCEFSKINLWKNEVLANMATILMSEMKDKEDVIKISVDEIDNSEKKHGLWD